VYFGLSELGGGSMTLYKVSRSMDVKDGIGGVTLYLVPEGDEIKAIVVGQKIENLSQGPSEWEALTKYMEFNSIEQAYEEFLSDKDFRPKEEGEDSRWWELWKKPAVPIPLSTLEKIIKEEIPVDDWTNLTKFI